MKILIGISIMFAGLTASIYSCEKDGDPIENTPEIEDITENIPTSRIDTFTFDSNGKAVNGKIYLPESYEKNQDHPAIFLIDYTEQHFKVAKDEFEKVIEGAGAIEGLDALVITLEEHRSVDAKPAGYARYYEDFKNMAAYVEAEYTANTNRSFIARGSEGGIVLMAMFLEESDGAIFDNFIVTDPATTFSNEVITLVQNDNFPKPKGDKKLHFSFSSSNNSKLCRNLVTAIVEANYPWLVLKSEEYLDNDYENTYPVSFAAGLKFIFMG